MNLDELVNSIPNNESKHKASLAIWINDWKKNSQDVDNLAYLIGKWHGNVWFEDTNISNQFYKDFCEFREKAIYKIDGLTMNERLYFFSLFDLWDLNNTEIQNTIRLKLKAQRL